MHKNQVRALLVDDDEDDYVVTRDLLSESNSSAITLEWVATYSAALEAMARHDYDVCLVDYRLGERTGIELLREVVARRYTAPVILLTGQGDHEVDVAAMEAGAADYLVKGQFGASLLERSIRYAIKDARTLEALRASEERYALAARGANDGLWDWNLKTDEVYFSTRWKSMLGYEASAISHSADEWFSRVHPEDRERVKAEIAAHLAGMTPHFENEHRMRHQDGTYRWMLSRGLAVRDASEKAYRLAGSQTDLTDRKVAEERLRHAALHDVLTGLPNRASFMDRLKRSLGRAKQREDYLFAVLFLDLDRFKMINDSLGHLVGDQLIVEIARRLEVCLRPSDMIARLGGDEFTILLDHLSDASDASHIAGRIQKELARPFNLNGHELFTTASIGIALSSPAYVLPDHLLRDADIAMYRAKERGKGRCEFFDTAMHDRAVSLLQLETDLRRAVENQEFQVYYQPIVSLPSGRISGFEALVRWLHPQRGLISPAEFISMAEETGLINLIGHQVLTQACRQMRTWQEQFPGHWPLTISVNLSGKQFSQHDLIKQIDDILKETGLRASSLKLEITESAIMANTEAATAMLVELKALGIELSIDDFGTGYSSLSYLHRFPIDTLKIDHSFVSRMGLEDENSEMVRTIITMAHNLGLDVVAEGVEMIEQMAQLSMLKCEYGQGYFFSKPVDSKVAGALIAAEANKVCESAALG